MLKRIIFVLPHMLARGVEKSLLSLLECLPRSEYDITVMFAKKEGEFLGLIPDDVKITEMPLPEQVKCDVNNDMGTLKKVIRAIRQFKYTEGIGMIYRKKIKKDPLGGYTISFDKMANVPEEYDIAVCYHIHASFLIRYVADKINAKKKVAWIHNDFSTTGFEPKLYQREFNVYDRFFCVSQQLMDEFIERLPEMKERTFLFHNIVSAEQIQTMAGHKMPEEYKGSRQEENYIILSVGSLDEQKGFDIAVETAKLLYSRNIKFDWWILGEGPERINLEKQISEKGVEHCIHLCGIRMNPYPYYKYCDLYVQPSRHEGYGLAVDEARKLCCPMIVTDFAGAKEQLKNGITGTIVKLNSVVLADEIEKLLIDFELRKRYSKKLKEENSLNIKKDYPQVKLLTDLFKEGK